MDYVDGNSSTVHTVTTSPINSICMCMHQQGATSRVVKHILALSKLLRTINTTFPPLSASSMQKNAKYKKKDTVKTLYTEKGNL